jgi:hypothetical protein
VFEGEWVRGMKHGRGVGSYPDGSGFDGIYYRDQVRPSAGFCLMLTG